MRQQCTVEPARPRPFVKWAGGKRQLLPALAGRLPAEFGAYHEPFLGGGAVMLHLLSSRPGLRCSASDLNPDLVLAYSVVRDRVGELVASLREHERRYLADRSAYYYAVRASEPSGGVARASRLVFLNRTCFNGLYRVNRSGKFNVPLGRYSRPAIVNEDNLRAVSALLRSGRVDVGCRDFADAARGAAAGDLVYLDPPYQPSSRTASFTAYTSGEFGPGELRRLAATCRELDAAGCKVVLSNSDTPEVRSLFGRPWRTSAVRASRAINSDAGGRAGHTELVITNF